MLQLPLSYGRQNKDRKTRIGIHILLCQHIFLSLVYVYVLICRLNWYFGYYVVMVNFFQSRVIPVVRWYR